MAAKRPANMSNLSEIFKAAGERVIAEVPGLKAKAFWKLKISEMLALKQDLEDYQVKLAEYKTSGKPFTPEFLKYEIQLIERANIMALKVVDEKLFDHYLPTEVKTKEYADYFAQSDIAPVTTKLCAPKP